MKASIINKNSYKTPPETYSIGLLAGDSPFSLRSIPHIPNPIISRHSAPHSNWNFVADPFLIKDQGKWHLFYEVMPQESRKGIIAYSSSEDLSSWMYGGVILEEHFHLSYPLVFKSEGAHYMIPEMYQNKCVTLYKAQDFPYTWKPIHKLLEIEAVDSTIFKEDHTWWLFTCDKPAKHNRLRLFYADELETSNWTEHPESPIKEDDPSAARPGGKIFRVNGKVFRVAQDCSNFYGEQINTYEIIRLSKTHYEETPVKSNPLIKGTGLGWNNKSMHHIDLHQINSNEWIAVADGRKN